MVGQHLVRPGPHHGGSGESVQIYKRDVIDKPLVFYALSSEKVHHVPVGQHLVRPDHGGSGESVQIYKRDVTSKALV